MSSLYNNVDNILRQRDTVVFTIQNSFVFHIKFYFIPDSKHVLHYKANLLTLFRVLYVIHYKNHAKRTKHAFVEGILSFQARAQNCAKLLVALCLSIRPSASMEQLGFHRTDFHEITHFGYFS